MAHEITVSNALKTTPSKELVFFFGYARGFFYDIFNANHHNNGVSGSGGYVIIERDKMMECIDRAKERMYEEEFVNPTDIWDFINKVESLSYDSFMIQFT